MVKPGELQGENFARGARHSHEADDRRGGARTPRANADQKLGVALHSCASEAPQHSGQSDLVRVRQRVHWRHTRPRGHWPLGRR